MPYAVCVAALALLLGGCVSVQKDARFGDVRAMVSDRTGENLDWSPDGYPADSIRAATKTLTEKALTADAAVQVALLNNRRLQASLQKLGIAQADLVEAGLLENPVMGAGALFQDAGTEIELDVVQNFLGVFTLSARRNVGDLEADRVALEVSADVIDLAVDVREQYYKVVGDAESLALARKVAVGAEAAAQIAQRQLAAGNLSKREQSMQQSFYAESVLEVAQAEVRLESDREKLTRLMGLWGESTAWTIPDRLPTVPETLPDLTSLETIAISNRLDLTAAKKALESLDQNLSLARQTRWLGPLGIGVQFKRDAGGETSYGPKVELGLPFFDRGQSRIARLEARRRQAQESLAALAVEIRSEARETRMRLVAARQVALHYEKALLPIQQTIVSETLKFYNGMLLGVYDLLAASREQVRTSRQYIAANRDFWVEWAGLERAVGRRVPPTGAGRLAPAEPGGSESPMPDEHTQHHGENKS